MRRLIITLAGGAVALTLALVGLAAFMLSREDVAARVGGALSHSIGRQVVIQGPVGLSFFPVVGVSAQGVSIANAPGGGAAHMVEARRIAIGVALLPLFHHEVQIKQLTLTDAVIALEIGKDGAPNWIFAPPRAPPARASTAKSAPGAPRIDQVSLSGVSFENARVLFSDVRSNQNLALEKINATAALSGLDQPFSMQGEAVFKGEPFKAELSVGTPRLLISGQPLKLSFEVNAAPLLMKFAGGYFPAVGGGEETLKGDVSASGPDLRRLSAWLGSPIGEGQNLRAYAVNGKLTYSASSTAFENAAVKLDALNGRGDFLLETSHGKPYLSGRLEMLNFDLNPYLATATSPPAQKAAGVEAVTAPRAMDVKKAGWDATPIDASGLKIINANLDLTVHDMRVHKLRIDATKMIVVLNDGYLAATLSQSALYGGQGSGSFQVDGRADTLKLSNTLDVEGVRARDFMGDAIGFDSLQGAANATIKISAAGRSQKDLLEALDGSGAFRFTNGALLGVDFGGVTKTIKNVISGKVTGPNAKTDFTALSATFVIRRGVAVTDTFNLDGPGYNVKGMGAIDIGKQALDLRFTPRTVFSRDAMGKAKSTGIPLPVRGYGPWTQLKFTTDIRGKGKKSEQKVICSVVGGRDC